jgi:hypothetical protein
MKVMKWIQRVWFVANGNSPAREAELERPLRKLYSLNGRWRESNNCRLSAATLAKHPVAHSGGACQTSGQNM